MDSNTNELYEAKFNKLEAQMAVLRKDLSSLRKQVVKLIIIQNEMQYEQKMGNGIRLRAGGRDTEG